MTKEVNFTLEQIEFIEHSISDLKGYPHYEGAMENLAILREQVDNVGYKRSCASCKYLDKPPKYSPCDLCDDELSKWESET